MANDWHTQAGGASSFSIFTLRFDVTGRVHFLLYLSHLLQMQDLLVLGWVPMMFLAKFRVSVRKP